jgi:hypothetical protein
MYPGYTLAQLEAAIADGRGTDAMKAEVAARKSGASVVFKTPQIVPGK